jgi:Uma2 family endonuclease
MTTTKLYTPADVLALPDDGNRYECIDGELLVTPAPRPAHEFVIQHLRDQVEAYLADEPIGRAFTSPAAVTITETDLVQPDFFVAVWTKKANPKKWSDITALHLTVEVLSPATARRDRTIKRRYYQRARVPEYWVVDAERRVIERWFTDALQPDRLTETLTWQPKGSKGTFSLDIQAIFEAALGPRPATG